MQQFLNKVESLENYLSGMNQQQHSGKYRGNKIIFWADIKL